jgi:peptide/nickel transport system permease protein
MSFWSRIRAARDGKLDEHAPVGVGNQASAQESMTGGENETQWALIWRKFRHHKLAMGGLIVVLIFYFVALFAEFLAPMDPRRFDSDFPYAPPHTLRLFEQTERGTVFNPHILAYDIEVDAERFVRYFVPDEDQVVDVGFFVRAEPYRLLGLIPMQRRFFGTVDPQEQVFLLGADRLGRDLLSRMIHGTRVSMTVGLVGVTLSLVLGVMLGGISGYFGGGTDNFIQRVIEFLQSIPSIPLWLGLSAAIPPRIPPLTVYFLITVILSVLGWTGLARVVRGKFMSLKSEDFVLAARLDGCSSGRVIRRHMVPSFTSHIIATTTLAVPRMIIGETSLSFLGLGLRPPVISWGVLMQEAQNIRTVSTAPWLLLPGLLVTIAVLALNFLGDGLRDASDPYA